MKNLKPLLPYFKPYRKQLWGGILCSLLNAMIGLAAPLIVGAAIDSLKEGIDPKGLLVYGLWIIFFSLAQGVFLYQQRMFLVSMSRDIEFDIRNAFFGRLEILEPAFFQRQYTGDLMARATNDLQAVRMICGPAIMYTSNTLFTGVAAFVLMLQIHVGMTFLALCTMPVVALLTRIFGRRIHFLFQRVQEDFSDLSARVQENISGARVVRAYAQEDAEEKAFDGLNQQNVESNRRLIRWNAAFNPLLQSVIGFGFVAVLFYGGRLILQGQITAGEFVTANLLLTKMVWPMIAIGWVINLVERGTASLKRLQAVLRTEPEVRDHPPLVAIESIHGDIRYNDLTFAYADAEPVLKNISLSAPAGSTLALVGRTGSGKSTLLSLIPRLIEPAKGALWVDGHDSLRLPLEQLRQSIAMVPQETFLFSATIRDNIAFGRPDATDEQILEVAHLAGLENDLADSFPKGLETMVGERGITLSGGQKQRVALARAILRDPQILLLDDCLSAVDAETEERILNNLRRVFPGRTVFMVSHRVSAVRNADQILVLDQGEIRERGTHNELLQLDGLYADLSRRQQLEEQLGAA